MCVNVNFQLCTNKILILGKNLYPTLEVFIRNKLIFFLFPNKTANFFFFRVLNSRT